MENLCINQFGCNCCGDQTTVVSSIEWVASLPVSGVVGILYINTATNTMWRWTGSVFVQLT